MTTGSARRVNFRAALTRRKALPASDAHYDYTGLLNQRGGRHACSRSYVQLLDVYTAYSIRFGEDRLNDRRVHS
jgi:hypothetical protein